MRTSRELVKVNNELDHYMVVRNREEQYSIWPSFKEVPNGWDIVRRADTKEESLKYIKEVWLDMRPLSLRKHGEKS